MRKYLLILLSISMSVFSMEKYDYQIVPEIMTEEEDSIAFPENFNELVEFWNSYDPERSTLRKESLPNKIFVDSPFPEDVEAVARIFKEKTANAQILLQVEYAIFPLDHEDQTIIQWEIDHKKVRSEWCWGFCIGKRDPTYLIYFYPGHNNENATDNPKQFWDRKINLAKQYSPLHPYAKRVWYLIQQDENRIPFNNDVYQKIKNLTFAYAETTRGKRTVTHKRAVEAITYILNQESLRKNKL